MRTFVANRQTWSLKLARQQNLMNKYVSQADCALCLYCTTDRVKPTNYNAV